MFAGYIHIGSKIYAFRDRVGEKPLYFGFYKDLFFISSNYN
jgi:asparagine synthetase B (glutamine-hydrolysing)